MVFKIKIFMEGLRPVTRKINKANVTLEAGSKRIVSLLSKAVENSATRYALSRQVFWHGDLVKNILVVPPVKAGKIWRGRVSAVMPYSRSMDTGLRRHFVPFSVAPRLEEWARTSPKMRGRFNERWRGLWVGTGRGIPVGGYRFMHDAVGDVRKEVRNVAAGEVRRALKRAGLV